MKLKIFVEGMHCGSCEMLIKDALLDAGAKDVEASFKDGVVTVETDLSEDQIKSIIKEEGYRVVV